MTDTGQTEDLTVDELLHYYDLRKDATASALVTAKQQLAHIQKKIADLERIYQKHPLELRLTTKNLTSVKPGEAFRIDYSTGVGANIDVLDVTGHGLHIRFYTGFVEVTITRDKKSFEETRITLSFFAKLKEYESSIQNINVTLLPDEFELMIPSLTAVELGGHLTGQIRSEPKAKIIVAIKVGDQVLSHQDVIANTNGFAALSLEVPSFDQWPKEALAALAIKMFRTGQITLECEVTSILGKEEEFGQAAFQVNIDDKTLILLAKELEERDINPKLLANLPTFTQ